jgi:hypothetical protein
MTFVKTTSLSAFKLSGFFQDSQNKFLPVLKALLFLLLSVCLYFLIKPVMPLVPKEYRQEAGSILLGLIGIGLTWLFVKKEGGGLAAAGFELNRKWLGQLVIGILPGIPVMLLIVWIEGVFFDTSLALNENFRWPAYLFLFQGVLWSSLFQEVIFRGYIFSNDA